MDENNRTITANNIDIGYIPFYKPTMSLRWAYKLVPQYIQSDYQEHVAQTVKEKVLQQLWIGTNGEEEWRDIELIDELQ